MSTCAHVWPAELEPDATCLAGCGLVYADWSEVAERLAGVPR